MKTYELKITLTLKRDIHLKEYIEFVSKNINYIFYNSVILRAIHEKKGFKPYVVGSMYPFESKIRMYQSGNTYTLTLRTIDEAIANEIVKASKKAYNLDFDIKDVSYKELRIGFIDKVYTVTPAVLTLTDEGEKPRYWTIEDDLLLLQRRIVENLEKKYKEFFKRDIKPPEDTINFFTIHNQKPIVYYYKGGKIFANKFTIGFNSDKVSQKLAKLSFGVGVLEKNPLGFGMVVRGR